MVVLLGAALILGVLVVVLLDRGGEWLQKSDLIPPFLILCCTCLVLAKIASLLHR